MVYRNKTKNVEMIISDGVWLGLFDEVEEYMENDSFELQPGDVMLLYTDGITEAWKKGAIKDQRDPEKDMFGSSRLKEVLSKSANGSPEDVRDSILDTLVDYDIYDDVTMIVIKRD